MSTVNMEDENTEVLFEGWGFRYIGSDKKRAIPISSSWKKRYLVLMREDHHSKVLYYGRKPRNVRDSPKGSFELYPEYKIQKVFNYKEKQYASILSNQTGELCVAFEDEKLFHLFCFFIQTHTHLREEYEGECFVVRPDNSDGQRKIGARGNMCVLHICPWGIILALQLSKCVLAQWPLKAIKWYESSGRQQFGFEAGRKSPMGSGVYVFNTRAEQDNTMYDKLDSYVMEAAGFKQVNHPNTSFPNENFDNVSMDSQLMCLQSLMTVYCDGHFTATLKRISRDIYDHLSQHFGGSLSNTRPVASSAATLLSDTTNTWNQSTNSLCQAEQITALSTTNVAQFQQPIQQQNESMVLGIIPYNRPYENDIIEHESATARKIKEQNFTSTYLAMNSPIVHSRVMPSLAVTIDSDTRFGSSAKSKHSPPHCSTHSISSPDFQKTPSSPKNIPSKHDFCVLSRNHQFKGSYSLAKHFSDTDKSPRAKSPIIPGSYTELTQHHEDSYSPMTSDLAAQMETQQKSLSNIYTTSEGEFCNRNLEVVSERQLKRIQSQSLEDFTQYETMTHKDLVVTNYLYNNEGFRMSDEVKEKSSGLYSYAYPSAFSIENEYPTLATGGYNYIANGAGATSLGMKTYSSLVPPHCDVEFCKGKSIYARPLPKAIRKSRSIPNFLHYEGENNDVIQVKSKKEIHENNNPLKSLEPLAFANNMFKDELNNIKQRGVVCFMGEKPKCLPSPDVKAKAGVKLSLFKRTPHRNSSTSSTSGNQSMSVSPISPHPSGVKSPSMVVRGITFTPKTKSFKKAQLPESGLQETESSNKGNLVEKSSQSLIREKRMHFLLQESSNSYNNLMEGRHLPSLPPKDTLNEDEENESAYSKVEETLC